MNFTSSHALQHDKNVLQNVAVPRCDPPKSWGYMHRIKWALALPVKPGGRLVAVAIADHVNEKTGSWCISAAQLAAETGLEARAVRRHVNDSLRAYFTVEDRPGRTWRFSMPAPLMTVVLQPRIKCPDPPDKMSDVPCKEPRKYVPAVVVITNRRQQQQLSRRTETRIEGLFSVCAVRARQLGLTYDEADERARLRAGETNLGDIQALADQLADDLAQQPKRKEVGAS